MGNNQKKETLEAFARLLDIMRELRAKCPWDGKQTFESLRQYTIEEVYELAAAVDEQDVQGLKKELGDVLMHVLFYAVIAQERSLFSMLDVCKALEDKLIYRHPHVFGDSKASTPEEVERQWEAIKLKEKGGNRRVLEGVPKALPPLVKAQRISEKAAAAGFEWRQPEDIWPKVYEELEEFKTALASESTERQQAEMGDVFFALVNAARLYHIDPAAALEHTNREFMARFDLMEQQANAEQLPLQALSFDQWQSLWATAKKRRNPPHEQEH